MAISSVKNLAEYCLRRLGKPVINIEIEDTQLTERVNDAIKFFVERHFDGVEEIYYKKTILPDDVTNGYLIIDDDIVAITEYLDNKNKTSLEIFDQAEYNFMDEYHRRSGSMGGGLVDYYMTQSYINTLNIITSTPNNSYSFNKASNKFYTRDNMTSVGSGNLLSKEKDFADWTTNNAVLTLDDEMYANDELEGHTITSSDNVSVFGLSQSIPTKFYVRGTFTQQVILKAGTYTGNVVLELTDRDGVVVGTEIVTLSNRWEQYFVTGTYNTNHINDLVINIRSNDIPTNTGDTFFIHKAPSLYKNNFVVVKGYKALTTDDIEIFEDRYLQRLATAYVKQQWGNNTGKYNGVQLPGGITMRGAEIAQEAKDEIREIELEIVEKFEMPPMGFVG